MGLAKSLSTLAVDPDDFDVHHVFPDTTSLSRLLGVLGPIEPRAGGAGLHLADATNRAMGELLERYAAFAYGDSPRLVASYREIVDRGLRPLPLDHLILFTQMQLAQPGFAYKEFTAETPVGWFEGLSLGDGRPTYVPGQLVSIGYRVSQAEVPNIFYATSSGCAVASSAASALLSGLLELIERDAIMIRWYARLPPPRLELDPAHLLGRPLSDGPVIRFHDLTVDVEVPVVGVTCTEDSGRPCSFLLGAAAAMDTVGAARKALIEVAQGRPFIKIVAIAQDVPEHDAIFDDFDSNIRFYAEGANRRFIEWFAANSTTSSRQTRLAVDTHQPADQVAVLVEQCLGVGLEPIVFDMTLPEMRDHGLFACKLVVPQLVPLCVPSAPFLGHGRLAGFITRSKQSGETWELPDWLPHPFP